MTWQGTAPSGTVLTINVDGSVARVDWEEARGDVSGVIDNLIVIALQQTPVSPAVPASGFILGFDGARWLAQSPSVLGSGSTHALLSATHIDTVPANPTRGDLVTASSAPAWARFSIGASGTILGNDGDDLGWIEHGIFVPDIITAGATVTLNANSRKIVINKSVGSATAVSMPVSPKLGQTVLIKDGKGDAKANNITIDPTPTTIDGFSSIVMTNNYQAFELLYNGTEWNIV